ncbi:MAG: glycosyltransferase family 2 protein [Acidobacteriota bacterium]
MPSIAAASPHYSSGIAVVIPVLDACRTLPTCLRALERLHPSPDEIVLVDNGSTDGSLELLRSFAARRPERSVRILVETKPGAAAARNCGVLATRRELIAFTDADCAPETEWLRYLVEPFEEEAVGGVAGRVMPAPPASTLELFNSLYTLNLPSRPARSRRWTPWLGGYPTANLAVRRSLLQQVGGFDESVGIYGEDYDLCARLYDQGAEIAYNPAARVAHHHRVRLPGMVRQAFGFGRSHPYLLHRHGGRSLWVDLPGRSFVWENLPLAGWIDFAAADKKMLTLVAIAAIYHPLLLLLPLYAGWLGVSSFRRAQRAGLPVSGAGAMQLATLLLLKSATMSVGRWWGSLRYGALCF